MNEQSAGEGTLLPDAKPVNHKSRRRSVPPRRRTAALPPESSQMAAIALAGLFEAVEKMPFCDAVSRLTGVRDLMANTPELAPYRAALTDIIEGEAILLELCAALSTL